MSTSSGHARKIAGIVAAMVAASGLVAACGSPGPNQPTASPATSAVSTSTPSAGTQPPGAVPADTVSPGSTWPGTAVPSSTRPAGPSATTAPATSPAPAATGIAGLAPCSTAKLLITVDDSQAGGSAGSAYYPLNFTSTSSTACEIYGFPGVSFTAAPTGAGRQIGVAAQRSTAFPKVAIRLAPGASAHAWLRVTVAGNYPASSCQPVTVHWLRIYPPGETVPGYVEHDFSACSSASLSLLTVLPVRSGNALAGVTP
jgi:hypothetical protein